MELFVVPAVSRILHYGFVGGANVIWQNLQLAGEPARSEVWRNFGGHKTWIWPEHEWPTRTGSPWPPPTDLPETIVSTAEVLEPGCIRLRSSPITAFGLRIVREIRLSEAGTRVELLSELVKEGTVPFPIAAWTVTQVPADGAIFARLMAGSRLANGYKSYFGQFAAVTGDGEDVLAIERRATEFAKVGMDADLLAWQRGELLFVERSADRSTPVEQFPLGDRGQVYAHQDGDPTLPAGVSYVELELTSPMREVRPGQSVRLATTWELQRLPPAQRSRTEVARLLRAL